MVQRTHEAPHGRALRLVASFFACVTSLTQGATTTIHADPATASSGNLPSTLAFPLSRSGDTTFDAALNFHTVDGTAVGGIDYKSTTGSLIVPAGVTTSSILVPLAPNTGADPSRSFQLVLDGASGLGPHAAFAPEQPFGTDHLPDSVAVADLNGDGKLDLITANYYGFSVSVLVNTTTIGASVPSFATRQTFPTSGYPICVVATDINGDGKPDLIVLNSAVTVLINTTPPGASTVSFASPQIVSTSSGTTAVVADINGDGSPDLIFANYNDGFLVLLNTTPAGAATASFAPAQKFVTGHLPYAVDAADFNGDGKTDVVIVNTNDDTASVWINATAPGSVVAAFLPPITFPTGVIPSWVATSDLDGDGRPDIVIANGGESSVGVFLNTTPSGSSVPSFSNQWTFPATLYPSAVVAADLNGDGKPDLVATNFPLNTLSILLNATVPGAAVPNFVEQEDVGTGISPLTVIAADLNSDGKADLITSNYSDDTVSVLINTTPSPSAPYDFAGQQVYAAPGVPQSIALADLNGDGRADVIVTDDSSSSISVLLNKTVPGGFVSILAQAQSFAAGNAPASVTTADINGDGLADVITTDFNSGTVSVLLNETAGGNSSATFGAPHPFVVGFDPFYVLAADLNGDGRPDLIVANFDNTISVLLNNTVPGASTPSFEPQASFAAGSVPDSIAVADLDGDGRLDLMVANIGDDTVSVLLNTTPPGASMPSFAPQQVVPTGHHPTSVAAVDVNGDGRPDLVVANAGDDTVSVLSNVTLPGSSKVHFVARATFQVGAVPSAVAAVDIDGDGLPDLIVANYGDATASVLRNVTPAGGKAKFVGQRTFPVGEGPAAIATADINGDGRPDVLIANSSAASVSVLLNTQFQTLVIGSPATGTIVHDYVFANSFE